MQDSDLLSSMFIIDKSAYYHDGQINHLQVMSSNCF